MEVSNLARSMGIAICAACESIRKVENAERNVPALLGAIALVHDLGNPPFGHQGEVAIRTWVEEHEAEIKQEAKRKFNRDLLKDFLLFEGNAQGFRVLTRLQHQDYTSGLRLTASTLRAFMKYPWMSDSVHPKNGKKKFGIFRSEQDVFNWSCDQTGLEPGTRHPLSYLMEVCDDIAYSVLDIEDAVKKELVSAADLMAFLNSQQTKDDRISSLLKSDAIDSFVELEAKCGFDALKKGIAENFVSSGIVAALKDFAGLRVYKHPDVLKAELQGHHVIPQLMTAMWRSVVAECHGVQTKLDEYVMALMSPNYLRVYKQSRDLELPDWYRQVQLVCDQVCGMTDSYYIAKMDVDAWELQKSYPFIRGLSPHVSVLNLLRSVCFSTDGVAVSLKSGRTIRTVVFDESLDSRSLNFVVMPQKLEATVATRIARLSLKLNVSPTDAVAKYFLACVNEFGMNKLIIAENRWGTHRMLNELLFFSLVFRGPADLCQSGCSAPKPACLRSRGRALDRLAGKIPDTG